MKRLPSDMVVDRIIVDSVVGKPTRATDIAMLLSDGRVVRFGFGPSRVTIDFDANGASRELGPTMTLAFEGSAFEVSHCASADVDPPSGVGGVGIPEAI